MNIAVALATLALVALVSAASSETSAAGSRAKPAGDKQAPTVFGASFLKGPWKCAKSADVKPGQAALCRQGRPNQILVDQVYTINLAKRIDRWKSVVAEMETRGVRTTRFDAIDGSMISEFEYEILTQKNIRKLTKGLVGNLISHMRVWQDIADRGWGRALIFEDDATFEQGFKGLDALIDELDRTDPNWDFVYTGRLSVPETWLLLKDEGVLEHFPEKRQDVVVSEHIVDPGASEGMWGYMLSAKGARAMIDAYKAAGLLFDVDLVLHMPLIRNRLRMYAFEPPISAYNESDAYSDDSNSKTGLNLLKRANKFVAGGQYREAAARYHQALEYGLPNHEQCWAHTNLAFITDLTGGDPAVAESHFETAIGIPDVPNTQRADTYGNYCYFLFRHGRLTRAAAACQEGLALDPSHEKCAANLQLIQTRLASGATEGVKNLDHKHIDL